MPALEFPTTLICDAAMDLAPVDPRITARWRGAACRGPAHTVRTPPGQNAAVRRGAETAPPGSVLVIDAGGSLFAAVIGDTIASVAQASGAVGCIVDGCVRDVELLEEIGFPTFALATNPRKPGKDDPGEVDAPVHCGGVLVHPGDVVYADADGVVVVPQARHDEIVARARALAAG